MVIEWGIVRTGRRLNVKVVPTMELAADTRAAVVYSRDMGRAKAFAGRHDLMGAYGSSVNTEPAVI